MKQPVLGITASALAILLSVVLIRALGVNLVMGWASYALMGAIPFAVVVGGFWRDREPRAVIGLAQPLRGMTYLLLAAVVAAAVSVLHWLIRGGDASAPSPMAVMTIITSVVTAFLLVIVLDGWPFSLIPNKLFGGIVLLVSAYLLNAAVFHVFFNFSFAVDAPWYRADLDPAGLFNAWDVVAVMVTAAAIMFVFLLLDNWPLSTVAALRSSPAFGMAWLISCLALGWVVFWVCTSLTGMPSPTYLVRVPIPFIFGSILLLSMLHGSLNVKLPQPLAGLINIVIAMVGGSALAFGYTVLMPTLSGHLPAGAGGDFQAEIWLANALLAVTFPLLAFHSDFFRLWPLARDSQTSERVTQSSTVEASQPH